MEIGKIGIIGAGQMGTGIAHVCAVAGLEVTLQDMNSGQLLKALDSIDRTLERQVAKRKLTAEDKQIALARIHTTSDFTEFSVCDLVIEAATEQEDVKRAIFKELTPHLRPDALLASNTSSISITRLGAATDRPERFIGMHFMNPAPVMQLVELIRGIATDDATYEAIRSLTEDTLGKKIAVSEDYPAFIVNRILMPMLNEAIYVLYEGVGSVEAIDIAMHLGVNHPLGPLALADFIGLDTCLSIMQVLYEGLADSKYRPCPLLVKYVEAGWIGRKVGRGFYDYRGETPVPTR
jgi:3-hydroxybutyryl-CoA dehydrogenase